MLDHVIYPPQYDPRISPIYALNEVDVKAPAAAVWRLLVDAGNWFRCFRRRTRWLSSAANASWRSARGTLG